MSSSRTHLSLVVDEVLAQANDVTRRRHDEVRAIKAAEAAPRTDLARGLRTLADATRRFHDDVTYSDLSGAL